MIQRALEAEPGKLFYHKTLALYSIYQFFHWFTLQTGDFNLIINFRVYSTSSTSFKKYNVKACSITKWTSTKLVQIIAPCQGSHILYRFTLYLEKTYKTFFLFETTSPRAVIFGL